MSSTQKPAETPSSNTTNSTQQPKDELELLEEDDGNDKHTIQ